MILPNIINTIFLLENSFHSSFALFGSLIFSSIKIYRWYSIRVKKKNTGLIKKKQKK